MQPPVVASVPRLTHIVGRVAYHPCNHM